MGQIINLDNSPPPAPSLRVFTRSPYDGAASTRMSTLAIVSRVHTNFRTYVDAHKAHKFVVNSWQPVYVWWGEYSRGLPGKDEFHNPLTNLRHAGWGMRTLGGVGPSFGSVADTVFGTAAALEAGENVTGMASGIGGKMDCATPTERSKHVFKRGDTKKNIWRDLMHAVNCGNRYFLALTIDESRGTKIMHEDQNKRLLGIIGGGSRSSELKSATHEFGEILSLI